MITFYDCSNKNQKQLLDYRVTLYFIIIYDKIQFTERDHSHVNINC